MAGNARNKWIETGYELFVKEGKDGIMVERLARILNLNKSGFYHYFNNPDNFLSELFNHHRKIAISMAEEIRGCEVLDPDYFQIVVKYRRFVLAQGQLACMRHNNTYDFLEEIRNIVEKPLLPLWQKTFNLPHDLELVSKHFALFRNVFFSQPNVNNFTYESLRIMLLETQHLMREIYRHERENNEQRLNYKPYQFLSD